MTVFFFAISLVSGVTLLTLSLASLWRPQVRFWPPPGINTWQYRTFWWLFRIFFIGIVFVCILDFGAIGNDHVVQFVVGIPLAIVGFGLAFYVTFLLGWRDAHGEANGLTTNGWYGWSRNPIYIVSIVGMVGLGLLVHSWLAYFLLLIWAAFYIAAPYLEEPWLEQQYGNAFREYKSKVPRFVGRPANQRGESSL
jgi:protein-S-isoprenylcysteine O-methyltransferase Ste14